MRATEALTHPERSPYFLWDDPIPFAELQDRLAAEDSDEWAHLAGRILREARFAEAMELLPIERVVRMYERIRPHLGLRRPFWDYLLAKWRSLGLLA